MKKLLIFTAFFLFPIYLRAQILEVSYHISYFLKGDTIYRCQIYLNKNAIDSVLLSDILILSPKKKIWNSEDSIASYEYKFRKKLKSKWFSRNNQLFFYAEKELWLKIKIAHYKDPYLELFNGGCTTSTTRFCKFGFINHVKETRSNCAHCKSRRKSEQKGTNIWNSIEFH